MATLTINRAPSMTTLWSKSFIGLFGLSLLVHTIILVFTVAGI
ncbi:hypothetical protein [Pedobacter cryoconitis]|uniref:Uncharacterized protein n=1 Tax=Pedobacter cryoconitis TaxID=188932 RepID=A0A7X0J3D5_9SPHI|nr:hypothetical protein [Pedobacter cryoconitis]MBB6500115.1 hypothetical protein [Pedobacter cryoconitis]